MPRNDSGCGRRGSETGSDFAIDRRSCLKAAGIAAGSAALFSGSASAAEHRGIRFKRTVNMVEDAGCDPTGTEPCDEQLRAAADDYTLLKFPAGTYKFTEKNVVLDTTNLGFRGEGDVRFAVPEGYNEKLLVADRGTGLLFENIDIDQRAHGATPGLHLGAADDLQIHDVEYIGQGIHFDSEPRSEGGGNPAVTNALSPIVRSADGTGVVENVTVNDAGLMGAYNRGEGRVGVWIGMSTRGTITLRGCHIEGVPNNGLYCSRTYGVVRVEGGTFRNNDISQVRIGSEGSYVDGATIEVDAGASSSPNPGQMLNGRGVRFEVGSLDTAGPEVRNCDITIADASHSGGGVVASGDIGRFDVRNTRIKVDVDGVRGVLAKDPTGGAYNTGTPYDGTLRNVSVTGSAGGTSAIELRQRSGSVIEGCCLQVSGADRNGVTVVDSDDCVLRNGTIDVTGESVVRENASVAVSGIGDSGTCPAPSGASPSQPQPEPEPQPESSEPGPDADVLTIEGASGADYELAASEGLAKTTTMDGATIDPNDTIDGATATGQVGGSGRDSFAIGGEITKLVLDGGANLYYNGENVDPAEYLPNTLSVESDTHAEFEFTASDGVVKSAVMGAADPNDSVSGRTVSGQVGEGGRDSFAYLGEIQSLDIDGDATVYRNGDAIDPDELGSGGSGGPNVLTIEGAPGADYELAASESLDKATTMDGATIDPNDTIDGATATGQVGGSGRDSFAIGGEITKLVLDGGANLYYNGENVDPAEYLPNTLSVESDTHAEFEFTASDGVVKSAVMGAADPNDSVNGRTVSGQVGEGGRDSFAYLGEIQSLDIDGDATVYRNGSVLANPTQASKKQDALPSFGRLP
ncbi:hypothetical protein [Halococcus salifodinae]|uniref:hypothetical protein n=1 Tax=Halococcus salifodinae TaxID=36738 RepID=UPI003F869BF3